MAIHIGTPRSVFFCAIVLLVAVPAFAQQQISLPVGYSDRIEALNQIASPGEYVENSSILLEQARGDLNPEQFAIVRLAVADAAKAWLLRPSTLSSGADDVVKLMMWGGSRLTADEQQGLARVWLLEQDAESKLPPTTVARLIKWGGPTFSDAERAQLAQSIDGQFPAVEEMTFAQLDANLTMKEKLTARTRESVDERRALVAQWVRTHDTSGLSSASLDRLVLYYLPPIIPNFGEFEVDWNGWIAVGTTGEYKFSISPVNISVDYENASHRQHMSVVVNGVTVVNANPNDWAYEGKPITLTANQPVPSGRE